MTHGCFRVTAMAMVATILTTAALVAQPSPENGPSGNYFFNTLGLAGTGPNSYVDKGAGDDMLPYTADDVTLPELGNLGGTWSLAHMDLNSDNKITADEHIFTIIRRQDDDSGEYSALSRPEYGVIYESEDWWDYHDARNEGPSKLAVYDPGDPGTWLSAAGSDFEHNDRGGWCGESNALLYNNLRANQHGEGKGKYWFGLVNPSNTEALPEAGWVYDEVEGWEKTMGVQQNYDDPNTPEDEKNGPGGCGRWNSSRKMDIRGYLIPVEDLATLQNGSLPSLFGWETVDLAAYFRDTIAPRLEDGDLGIFNVYAAEFGAPEEGYLPPTHIMLYQMSVPLTPNGEHCGGNDDGAKLSAEGLWGVPAEGATYRVSHLLGYNADYADEIVNAFGVRKWVHKPDDAAERNLWLLDHFYRDDDTHLGKYTLAPTDVLWSIKVDPEALVLDLTNDRLLLLDAAGAVVAPLPRPLTAEERPLEVVADIAEDEQKGGAEVVQIALQSATGVLAYAELTDSTCSLNLGGTFGADGKITGPVRSVPGTGNPSLGFIDIADGVADYTRYILQVTATGIKLSRITDGSYSQNDFNDTATGGTTIATLTFDAGESLGGDVAKVSVYGSNGYAVTTLAVFAGIPAPVAGGQFIRSDSNCDAKVDISDPINTLNVLFLGTGSICCDQASDANFDNKTDLSDAVFVLNFLFQGGATPPAPFPDCGGTGCAADPACP